MRQLAPQAFRAEQFRAVTEADCAEAAREARRTSRAPSPPSAGPGAGTRSSSASTPSTAPISSTCPNGRTRLAPAFERARPRVPRRATGSPATTSRSGRRASCRSSIEIEVCAAPGHFRADVAEAVRRRALGARAARRHAAASSTRRTSRSASRVYLSRLYAAVERVEGVESAVVSALPALRPARRGRARTRRPPDRALGDRAARQRPELHGARRADRHRRGGKG